jgi:hypothetical protein
MTLGELFHYLSPKLAGKEGPPEWPPDAFALAASALLQSGAYLSVVAQWPPTGTKEDGCLSVVSEQWREKIREIGERWRRRWSRRAAPPDEIIHWWTILRKNMNEPLDEIGGKNRICNSLLQICAAADEACWGVGFSLSGRRDRFNIDAESQLIPDSVNGSTLCYDVHFSRARVLPKSHTPQNGITLSSLSHHLALVPGGDVRPHWYTLPVNRPREVKRHNLNLLLLPWPMEVRPNQFRQARPAWGTLTNMSESFGFFTFVKESRARHIAQRVAKAYERGVELVGRIDMIVLPELALDELEFDAVKAWLSERRVSLLCGIGKPSRGGTPGRNYLALEVPISSWDSIPIQQNKHHRWRLDRSQIVQYGLGGQLDPGRFWWEHSSAEARSVAFVSLLPWLSVCALVCEDLARQEPVARLVRTVGPNLVIALLMDGPQLSSRWSSRYATVLADDPGSSVLTLTSVGMAELSRPPGVTPLRTVGLWKDAKSGAARQIDLPSGAEGIVLNLSRQLDQEWSADGRSDEGMAGYPILGGVHPVFLQEEPGEKRPPKERRPAVPRPRVAKA